ncbi:aminoacylase 1-like protein 2 [Gautieria morchelliformis]|nr:aminoacylase 1-like protein 2 [Gautieria morchelliformis]
MVTPNLLHASHVAERNMFPMDDDKQLPGCFSFVPFKFLSGKVKASTAKKCKSPTVETARKSILEPCGLDVECKIGETPPSYSSTVSDEPIFRPDVLKTIDARIDELDPELRKLSLQIHDHPEIMFKEKFAHDLLTEFMSSHGFSVTQHYLGLSTAWRASFKRGTDGPVLGVNSEMDALPGIGHACGHNLIAIAGVGVALGVKAAMEAHDIAGEIVLLGTPAEEGGGGKAILLDRGGYEDMNVCIMCHPGPGSNPMFDVPGSLAIQAITVEFFGHTAHASAAPWEGINALDAAVLAYTSISALRQQIKPTYRVHGIIEGRNWAPNVIPDYAKLSYIVRSPTEDEATELGKRVTACFKAAATSTGCTLKIEHGIPYSELQQNPVLGREFAKLATKRYNLAQAGPRESQASTDFGNISKALPALHPGYTIPSTSSNHTPEFTNASRTAAAHSRTLKVTKALSGLGVRVLADKAYLGEVKSAFEAAVGKV